MKDQELVWPFTTKALLRRWNEEVAKGGSDEPMQTATEIVCTLLDEIDRLRKLVKKAKQRHYKDAEFLCAEIVRLRGALIWIRKNLGGGEDYVSRAFAATAGQPKRRRKKVRS